MEYLEKKNRLRNFKNLENSIAMKKELYEKEYENMERISNSISGFKCFNFSGQSKLEKGIERASEIEKSIRKDEEEIETIQEAIEKLKYRQKVAVLIIDIKGKKIKDLANYLHVSYNAALLTHRRAIENIFEDNA